MIGFGSRSRPNVTGSVTGSVTAGRPSCCGVAVVGEGPEGSDGGMSADWGGRESRGGVQRGGGDSVLRRPATPDTECSGFSCCPKVVAVFPVRRGIGDWSFPKNIPIVSSLPNVPPILHVADFSTAGLTGKVDR